MKYECPFAHYVDEEIMCNKKDGFCENVRFCGMAQKWVLTASAVNCTVKNEEVKPPKKKATKKVSK